MAMPETNHSTNNRLKTIPSHRWMRIIHLRNQTTTNLLTQITISQSPKTYSGECSSDSGKTASASFCAMIRQVRNNPCSTLHGPQGRRDWGGCILGQSNPERAARPVRLFEREP